MVPIGDVDVTRTPQEVAIPFRCPTKMREGTVHHSSLPMHGYRDYTIRPEVFRKIIW
jgi:hypothetical protein